MSFKPSLIQVEILQAIARWHRPVKVQEQGGMESIATPDRKHTLRYAKHSCLWS